MTTKVIEVSRENVNLRLVISTKEQDPEGARPVELKRAVRYPHKGSSA